MTLKGWAQKKFGGVNAAMYEHVFDLILRLKGNYIWPAMWGKAFHLDDPKNTALADNMGMVMGNKHLTQTDGTKVVANYTMAFKPNETKVNDKSYFTIHLYHILQYNRKR